MQQTIVSSEEIFLSLFAEGTVVANEKKDVLKQILALMLQRKRILRAEGRPMNGLQKYIYSKTKEVFEVRMMNLTEDDIRQVEQELEAIIA